MDSEQVGIPTLSAREGAGRGQCRHYVGTTSVMREARPRATEVVVYPLIVCRNFSEQSVLLRSYQNAAICRMLRPLVAPGVTLSLEGRSDLGLSASWRFSGWRHWRWRRDNCRVAVVQHWAGEPKVSRPN